MEFPILFRWNYRILNQEAFVSKLLEIPAQKNEEQLTSWNREYPILINTKYIEMVDKILDSPAVRSVLSWIKPNKFVTISSS